MQQKTLEEMWHEHRDFLKRLLISLSHDIDLADDLLQETYLRAQVGIAGYRGGDARAWLATIAKNAFYAHARLKRSKIELPLDADCSEVICTTESDHLLALQVREAVSHLNPILRKALVMKHCGGFTYNEIAKSLGCPVGTAKWRVSMAVRTLRSILSPCEEVPMKCVEFTGSLLLDYLYGISSKHDITRIDHHLSGCQHCRASLNELRQWMAALDTDDYEQKLTYILEVNQEGGVVFYYCDSYCYSGPKTNELDFAFPRRHRISQLIVNGDETPFELVSSSPDSKVVRYLARLSRPITPGESIESLAVGYQVEGESNPSSLGDRKWRLREHYPIKIVDKPWVSNVAFRLPAGSKVLKVDPEAKISSYGELITLTWRRVLTESGMIEYLVEYQLPVI